MDEFLDRCVKPLEYDRELAQEVRSELRSHLEESSAEMGESEACRRFGNPETLGSDLLKANWKRLKRRSRLRLAGGILLFPLLLAIVVVGLDLRLLEVFPLLGPISGITPLQVIANWSEFPRSTPENTLIFHGDRSKKGIERWRPLLEKFPNSPEIRAYYGVMILYENVPAKKLIAEFERLRKLEPANAFFDYITASLLADEATKMIIDNRPANLPPAFEIIDRAKLDRAMEIYLAGTKKSHYSNHGFDMALRKLELLDYPDDLPGNIKKISITAGILIPDLQHLRALGRLAPFYGELLQKENNPRAGEYLDSWLDFIPQTIQNDRTLIGMLVAGAIVNCQKRFAQERSDTLHRKAAERVEFFGYLNQERLKRARENNQWQKHAGVFTRMLVPGLGEIPTPEELAPELKLSWLIWDALALCILVLTGLAVILVQTLYLAWETFRHRPGFLLTFSYREYGKLILWGFFLPVALYFLYTRIPFLSGRDCGFSPANLFRNAAVALGYGIAWSVWLRHLLKKACQKRARELGMEKVPEEVWSRNLIFGWLALLLLSTFLLRPAFYFGERHYIAEDKLVFPTTGFSPLEERVTEKIKKQLLSALAKEKKLKLEQR